MSVCHLMKQAHMQAFMQQLAIDICKGMRQLQATSDSWSGACRSASCSAATQQMRAARSCPSMLITAVETGQELSHACSL